MFNTMPEALYILRFHMCSFARLTQGGEKGVHLPSNWDLPSNPPSAWSDEQMWARRVTLQNRQPQSLCAARPWKSLEAVRMEE